MAQFNIDLGAFKEALHDICRPNRFAVSWDDPPAALFDNPPLETDSYFLKACSIPGKTMGEIDLNYCGQKYKIAGDPTFADVTMTFLNVITTNGEGIGDSRIHDYFEQWLNIISNDKSNNRNVPESYKTNVRIHQLDGNGNVVQNYTLVYAHPKELSEIALSMDTTDAVEEFNVVFSFSYYTTGDDPEIGGNPDLLTQPRSAP